MTRGITLAFWAASSVLSPLWAAELFFEDSNLGRPGALPADFKQRFEKPELWCRSLLAMGGFVVRANSLRLPENAIDVEFLRDAFVPTLKKNDVKLILDVPEATWLTRRQNETGKSAEELLRPTRKLYEKIKAAGGSVFAFSLQSILSKPLLRDPHYGLETAIQDVIAFMRVAKSFAPEVQVGVIDAIPTHGGDWKRAYRSLKRALEDVGEPLHHVILDVPFENAESGIYGMSWEKALEVERFVQSSLHAKFGISLTSRSGGQASAELFHRHTLAALERYLEVGGAPDWFIQMNWFTHPNASVPESDPAQFTALRTFLEINARLSQ